MKLSTLIFLKSARISLATFPLMFVNSLVQKTLLKLINSSKTCQAYNKIMDTIASFIYRAKKAV